MENGESIRVKFHHDHLKLRSSILKVNPTTILKSHPSRKPDLRVLSREVVVAPVDGEFCDIFTKLRHCRTMEHRAEPKHLKGQK